MGIPSEMTTYVLTAIGVVAAWGIGHVGNLYADQWKKRHEQTAGNHIEWLSKKALGWKWRFRWAAVLLGSSAVNQPVIAIPLDNSLSSRKSVPEFAAHFAKTTAATLLIGDKRWLKADAMKYGSDGISRIDPNIIPLEISATDRHAAMNSGPIILVERVDGGFLVDTGWTQGFRYTSEPKHSIADWITVVEFVGRRN
jgi:hypothetical protein